MLTYIASELTPCSLHFMGRRSRTYSHVTIPEFMIFGDESANCATRKCFYRLVIGKKFIAADRNAMKNDAIRIELLKKNNFLIWPGSRHKDSILISHERPVRVFSKKYFTSYAQAIGVIVGSC